MKNLVKKILPETCLRAAIHVRDASRLSLMQKINFNPQHIMKKENIDLSDVLINRETGQCWQTDKDAIGKSFPDQDRFGGINPGDRRALYYLITALKPREVLEIGTHIGASTIHIAKALHRNNQGQMTTVDILDVNAPDGPWKQVGMPCPPVSALQQLGCGNLVSFRASRSLDFMLKTDKKFDFIFLDGDHAPQTVYREVAAAMDILKPEGIILLHDYYPGGNALFPDGNVIFGPYMALNRIMAETPGLTVLPLGNLPWPTKQGSHTTSLALIARA